MISEMMPSIRIGGIIRYSKRENRLQVAEDPAFAYSQGSSAALDGSPKWIFSVPASMAVS